MKNIFILVMLLTFASCSPAVYRSYEDNKTDETKDCGLALVRIHPHDSIAEKIGEILIDDYGASINCSEEKTINYIKSEACSIGAQIVFIKQIKRPNDDSYCYRCTALLYKYKPGAKPIKTNQYYDPIRIKKREQLDRKKQLRRTVNILATTRRIIYLFTNHHAR